MQKKLEPEEEEEEEEDGENKCFRNFTYIIVTVLPTLRVVLCIETLVSHVMCLKVLELPYSGVRSCYIC